MVSSHFSAAAIPGSFSAEAVEAAVQGALSMASEAIAERQMVRLTTPQPNMLETRDMVPPEGRSTHEWA
jgi:hypothetical protein